LFDYWISKKLEEFDRIHTQLNEKLEPIFDPKDLSREHQNIKKSLSQLESNLNWASIMVPISRSQEPSEIQKRREKLESLQVYSEILTDLITFSTSIRKHLDRKLRIPSNTDFKTGGTIEEFNTESQKIENIRFEDQYNISIDTQNKYAERLLKELSHNLELFIHFLWFKYPSDEESQVKLLNWYSQVESKKQPPNVLSEHPSWTERPDYKIYGNNISLDEGSISLEDLKTIINPAYKLFTHISEYNSTETMESEFNTILNLNKLYTSERIEEL